jgi:surface antigen
MSGRMTALGGVVAMLGTCAGAPPAVPTAPAAEAPAAVVQYVLEPQSSGELVCWQIKGTAQRGTVTALRTFRGPDGFCRDYALTVSEVDGEGASWQTTACRDGEGQWHPVQIAEP